MDRRRARKRPTVVLPLACPTPPCSKTSCRCVTRSVCSGKRNAPLRFRLILCEPARFAPELGPPTGFHRLLFSEERRCTEHELYRLAPALDFYRSLIGVRLEQGARGRIWGLVHSGPRWLQVVHGGRETYQPLPAVLVVRVTGPGRLAVCQGLVTLATLHGGQIHGPLVDVFDSQWLPESFATVRAELWPLHTAARARANTPWRTA